MTMIYAMNIKTGKVAPVRPRDLKHPVLGKDLVEVDGTQKNYMPEMFQPKENKNEFFKSRKSKKAEIVEETVEAIEEKDE
jgi:hypothetical protein